jgi:hypothetical protein
LPAVILLIVTVIEATSFWEVGARFTPAITSIARGVKGN